MKTTLLAFIIGFSAIFSYTKAQIYLNADTMHFEQMKLIAIQADIREGRDWFLELTISPMSFSRLRYEYSRLAIYPKNQTKRIGAYFLAFTPPSESVIKSELMRRYDKVKNTKYNIIQTDFDWKKNVILINGVPDTSNYVGIYGVEDTSFEVDAVTGKPFVHDTCFFDPAPGDIALKSYYFRMCDNPLVGVPVHEFSHSSVDYNKYIYDETMRTLSIMVNPDTVNDYVIHNLRNDTYYSYYDSPGEIKARLDCARYELFKAGLYDARFEKFTKRHLRLILKNKEVLENDCLKDLLKGTSLPGEDTKIVPSILKSYNHLIWLMNNVA